MKRNIITALGAAALLFASGCTKLDENAYDRIAAEDFYTNKNEVISAVLRPYTHANAWITSAGQDGWWRLAELSGDQLAWPTKGRHGEDNGKWKRLHYHTWFVDEGGINQAWLLMYWGVGLCNSPIDILENTDVSTMGISEEEKQSYIAELKLLRALHYLKLMDLYGNIPITTEAPKTAQEPLPQPSTTKEVFDFIEKDILENIDKTPKLSKDMLGRMSQASGYAMLVELYLNAEKWSGEARWEDCVAAADKIISGEAGGLNGTMALDENLTDSYGPINDETSKETILSIAYDYQTADFEPGFPGDFYHFVQRDIYGGGRTGNNGIVVIPGVFTKYKDTDKRKKEWFLSGPMVRFDDGKPVEGSEEYKGEQLVFVDYIRRAKSGGTSSTMSDGEENSGVRFNKYKLGNSIDGISIEIDPVTNKRDTTEIKKNDNYNNTDWNVYRLTWVYFAKAEALMRINGGKATAEAVELINATKERAFEPSAWTKEKYTTATLTLDELLEELGREFIFEGFRRRDLIRFGKFHTASWWDHEPSEEYKTFYPIPQQQITMNPNLKQNPGY